MTNQDRINKAKEELAEWIEMHSGMVPSEDLNAFEEEVRDRQWVIEQAENGMTNTEGMEMKFTVIKNDDLDSLYLIHPQIHREFERAQEKVQKIRIAEGKKDNKYIVINTDEPYADEVIEIMKRHGHWG